MAAAVAASVTASGSGAGRRGGGLFRSRVKGPAEVVQHAREILVYITENQEASSGSGKCEAKCDHKVMLFSCVFFVDILFLFHLQSYLNK